MIGQGRRWAAAFAAVMVLACGDRRPEASAEPGEVVLKIVSDAPAAGGDSMVVARGTDTIVVRAAELVVREIIMRHDTLQVAPVRLRVPLGPDTVQLVPAAAPAGTYRALRFEIYPPTAERDSAFVASHPELAGSSVRVMGTISRAGARRPFVYALDVNEVQEFSLVPVLEVTAGGALPVLLEVDVAQWFLSADGTALIDPATASPGGPNAAQVRDNIRTSFAVRVLSSP